jgi:hypothetical protein
MKFLTSDGDEFFVSAEDADRVSKHRWHTTTYGYVAANMKEGDRYRHVRLHRWILGLTDETEFGDHRDGNTRNNRRENLRICTRLQNAANQRPRKGAVSPFKGVTKNRVSGRSWRASLRGKVIGHFYTAEEAALAYDSRARVEYGEFAFLNFPDRDEPVTGTKTLPRVCLHCGDGFAAADDRQKCCSKSCSTLRWQKARRAQHFGVFA